jgi:type VII secretion protein EccB
MPTKRDLVEAQAFNRRRLVAAFVSGAPGGREIEPPRPGRAVVAGAALAGLVAGAAAVSGLIKPTLPSGWDQHGVVVDRTSGARYLAARGVLYPVANTTSARLLLGARDFRVVFAPDDKIAHTPHGQPVGIVGAPDALPGPGDLVQTGWSSCLDGEGDLVLHIARTPVARPVTNHEAVVAETAQGVAVISDGHRYDVPPATRAATLRALRLDAVTPIEAPARWVDAFPPAPPLVPLVLEGAGSRLPDSAARPPGVTHAGTVVVVGSGVRELRYVVTPSGLVPLTPLAAALYEIGSGALMPEVRVDPAQVGAVPTSAERPYPRGWPEAMPRPYSEDAACALLETRPGRLPTVRLAAPVGDLDGRPDAPIVVAPGRGAVFRAVSGGVVNRGTVYVVDATGYRYAVGAPATEVLARLGFPRTEPVPVPVAWAESLADGPELSIEAARQAVSPAAASGP